MEAAIRKGGANGKPLPTKSAMSRAAGQRPMDDNATFEELPLGGGYAGPENATSVDSGL